MSSDTAVFTEPGRGNGLVDVFKRRYLLKLIVRKELRVRYRGSVLGMVWSYVKPAVQFIVFYFAMGVFLRLNESLEAYPIYLFSGIVVINVFGEAFGNATRSIVGNAPLIKKIYLPRELFPVSSVWVAIIHLGPQLVVLLIATLVVGWRPSIFQLLGGVLGFLIVVTLALGLGLFFGALNVSFRDSENLVDLMIMVATWTSPVLYSWKMVQEAFGNGILFELFRLNPLTSAVELFHWCFWYPSTSGTWDLPSNLLWNGLLSLGIALVVLLIGQLTFRRLEGRFAQEL